MRYSTCSPAHFLRRLCEARPRSLFAGRLVTLAALFAVAGGFAFAQSVTPPAQAAPGDDENAEVVVLPEFAVSTSTGDGAIRADETLGALRTSTLLIESPITVSVLTPEFMEAFMLDSEHDQVSFVAGGSALGEWQTGAGSAYLRGFNTGYFRNGFSRWGYNATVNVERVEYIKGPLAATFGRSAPGGVINYITKRAQRKPAYNLYFNTGSYGYENVQMSATGPVSKNLFYRVDFEYRDVGGVQDFFYQRTYTASTSFTWQIGKRTSWMFDFEHKLQTLNRGYAGLVMRWNANTFTSPVTGAVINSAVTGGRYTRFATFNPRGPDEWTQRKVSTFDTRFEHRFNRHLSFRLNGQHYSGNYARWGWGTTAGGSSVPSYRMESGLLPGRIPAHQDHDTRVFAGQADLLATFKIGPTSHKLLLTMDASDSRGENPDWTMSAENLAALPDTVRNLNVLRPDWGGFDRALVTELIWDNSTRTKNIGFILSERMELLRGRVLLYASLRHDDFYSRYENHLVPKETGSLSKNMFNETYGGVAHIIPGKLIVFANRSSSFTASTTIDLGTGELQDPITGRGIEAGARGEVLKEVGARHALYWSASIYRIDRRVPQLNPDYADEEDEIVAGIPQYLNSGIERVDGVELELFGNITKQFFLSLSYTKLDAHVKDYPEEPAREGVPLQYAPETCITSTARYKVTEGRLRGLTVGLTMRYNGEYIARYGTAGSQITGNDSITGNLRLNYGPITSIEVIGPAVTLFDAFAEYEFRTGKYRHTIGMNIKNLNDTVWYNRTGTLNPGRQIHLRYRLRF